MIRRTIASRLAPRETTPAPGIWRCEPQDDTGRVFYAAGASPVEACAAVADDIAEEVGAIVHGEGAIFGDVTVSSLRYMADVVVRRI